MVCDQRFVSIFGGKELKRFCYEFARNPRRGSVDADVLAFNDVFLLVDDIVLEIKADDARSQKKKQKKSRRPPKLTNRFLDE